MKYHNRRTKKNRNTKKYRTKKYRIIRGGDLDNPEWKYKKVCKSPKKMCDKTKINFALCVEDEADCDNPEYDFHYNPRQSKVAVNTFDVERFMVVPKDDLTDSEKEALSQDIALQEQIGILKSYVPQYAPTSCFIQKKRPVEREYTGVSDGSVLADFKIVTQNALGLYSGKPEENLDMEDPRDRKNKAILDIMKLRTAYFRKFLLESDYPDFLCFQEMTPEFFNLLYTESVSSVYKHVYPNKEDFDKLTAQDANAIVMLISKHPAIKQTTYMLQGDSSYYNALGVYEFQNMVIFNVYLQAGSPLSPGMKYNWENSSRCRRQQLRFIKKLIDDYAGKKAVVMVGDFNFELNSIHYDGSQDDIENWSELIFLKELGLKDSFKTLNPTDPGYTENTDINTLRYLGKLEHKRLRYDGIFFNERLEPTKSGVVTNIGLKIKDDNKGVLDIEFDPIQTNQDYELAMVFRPGDVRNTEKLEAYKAEKGLEDGYEIFVSDHFGMMTEFHMNSRERGGRRTRRKRRFTPLH
jgi:exonuclease III